MAAITIATPGTYDLAWFNANGAAGGVIDASSDTDGILITASGVIIDAPGLSIYKPGEIGVHVKAARPDTTPAISGTIVHGVHVRGSGEHGFHVQNGVAGALFQGCVATNSGTAASGFHGFSCGNSHENLNTGWTQVGATDVYWYDMAASDRFADVSARHCWRVDDPTYLKLTERVDSSCALNEYYPDFGASRIYVNVGAGGPASGEIDWYQGMADSVTFAGCVAAYTYDTTNGQEGHGFCFDAGISNGLAINCISYGNYGSGFQVNGGDNNNFINCRAERNARSFNFTRLSTNHSMRGCSYHLDTNIQLVPQVDAAGGADALDNTGFTTFNSMGN